MAIHFLGYKLFSPGSVIITLFWMHGLRSVFSCSYFPPIVITLNFRMLNNQPIDFLWQQSNDAYHHSIITNTSTNKSTNCFIKYTLNTIKHIDKAPILVLYYLYAWTMYLLLQPPPTQYRSLSSGSWHYLGTEKDRPPITTFFYCDLDIVILFGFCNFGSFIGDKSLNLPLIYLFMNIYLNKYITI